MSEIKRAIVSFEPVGLGDADLVLRPDANLRTGVADFARLFPDPTSLEQDALLVASSIFACDLAFKRSEREDITRNIEVTIPVVNIQAFERLKDELELILWVLSHDSWSFTFKRSNGTPEGARDWPKAGGKTLLFSGGLDSLAGAVDLFDELGVDGVQLSSHVTANPVTRSSQNDLASYLEGKYKAPLNRIIVRTGGHATTDLPFPADNKREDTQRTRSFMFLTIATLAARRSGQNEVVMIAENGQMAIHLSLTAGRMGAFSTHTAHPEFVHRVGDYFTRLLDFPVKVTNPYLYKTKGEVVSKLVSRYPDSIPLSVSCWRGARLGKGNKHCGECVPCLSRRVALESHGLKLAEYDRDLLLEDISALPPEDKGKTDLVDMIEFVHAFNAFNDTALEHDYPDMINTYIDKAGTISMYRRFAREAETVFARYPNVAKLMPSTPDSTSSPTKPVKPRPRKKSS